MSAPATTGAARAAFDPLAAERELLARCSELVDSATRGGADEAEACASQSASVSVRFEKGDLKLVHVDEGGSAGLRALRARRQGFVSTNQTDAAARAAVVRDALALAAVSPADEHNRLPAARPVPAPPGAAARTLDRALLALPVEEVVERAAALARELKARDPRLSIDQLELSLSRSSSAVAASTGAAASESDAALSFSVFGMAVDGEDVGGFHYTGDFARSLSGFEAATRRVLDEFASVALGNLGAGHARSYKGRVLFSPTAFLSVFVAPLVSAASAIAVQRGRSALAGKLGQRIAVETLAVHDRPDEPSLAGRTAFDREGQPCAPFALVEEGVLRGWMYNGYAAAVEGVASTGHAQGGARSLPGLGPHAIVVGGGAGEGRAGLVAELGEGLLVQRFSGTVDPASGDFSGVAKSARRVEGGRESGPVRETMISGNAFELLRSIVALSRTPERVSGAALAPWALVDGVSVTAG